MTCYDTNGAKGIHIGTSAEFKTFESEEAYKVFLCLGGSNDLASYDPATHLYAGVVFSPNVSQPNIKTYFGGGGIYTEELRKTYNINPDHVAAYSGVSQTNPGWSAKVRFDFCDGDEVIYSRTTWWGTKPAEPEEEDPVPVDICQVGLVALGAGTSLYDFYYQPVQLGAGDSPTKCTIKIVDPWEGEAGHNDIFSVGETKTYPNPDNEDEIYALTLNGIFKAVGGGGVCQTEEFVDHAVKCIGQLYIHIFSIGGDSCVFWGRERGTGEGCTHNSNEFFEGIATAGQIWNVPASFFIDHEGVDTTVELVSIDAGVATVRVCVAGELGVDSVELTACYQSGIPPDCLTPVIESITVSPENPIVGEKVEVTVVMAEGGGTFHLLRCKCDNDTRLIPIHSNVSKCTYYESGDYTIECSIVNTCGNHSEWVSVDITVSEPAIPPTITALTWSPKGSYTILHIGDTVESAFTEEYLKLIGTDPYTFADPAPIAEGQALLQIDSGDPFAVSEGSNFQFGGITWWVLNIICSPECAFITIADENAEAARIPRVGDTVDFQAEIDWHGEEVGIINWYYAKPSWQCFTDIEWLLFASGSDMVSHHFDNSNTDGSGIDDCKIVFLKVVAANKNGEVSEFGGGCDPIFNLWTDVLNPAMGPRIIDMNWMSPQKPYGPTEGEFYVVDAETPHTAHGDTLKLIGIDPLQPDEAIVQVDDGEPFTVVNDKTFPFAGSAWFVLHVVCCVGYEYIVVTPDAARRWAVPMVGDLIKFYCAVDWHGRNEKSVKWYFAKNPGPGNQIIWELFSNMCNPHHEFTLDTDVDIIGILVKAENEDGQVGQRGGVRTHAFNLYPRGDDPMGLLEIEFPMGTLYKYHFVRKSVLMAFLAAPSKGKFFWKNIRQETVKYPYTRVR